MQQETALLRSDFGERLARIEALLEARLPPAPQVGGGGQRHSRAGARRPTQDGEGRPSPAARSATDSRGTSSAASASGRPFPRTLQVPQRLTPARNRASSSG